MSDFIIDAQGPYIIVAPGDFRDYSLDWSDLLASLPQVPGTPPVDQITRTIWTVPAPNVASAPSVNVPLNWATIWISSPTIGIYVVSNTIFTAGGRDFTRSFRFFVTENI